MQQILKDRLTIVFTLKTSINDYEKKIGNVILGNLINILQPYTNDLNTLSDHIYNFQQDVEKYYDCCIKEIDKVMNNEPNNKSKIALDNYIKDIQKDVRFQVLGEIYDMIDNIKEKLINPITITSEPNKNPNLITYQELKNLCLNINAHKTKPDEFIYELFQCVSNHNNNDTLRSDVDIFYSML